MRAGRTLASLATSTVLLAALAVAGSASGALVSKKCKRETLHNGARVYDLVATGTTCLTAKAVAKPSGPHTISGPPGLNFTLHARPRYKSHGFACSGQGTDVSVGIANWVLTCWKGKPDAPRSDEITFQVTYPHGYKG
jgi:hypothetical protein